MKKVLLLCAVVLAFAATSANAALNLAWNDCFGKAGGTASNTVTFDCAGGGGPYKLIGSFVMLAPLINAVALDVIIDVTDGLPAPIPSFWQFQTGGCNELGVAIVADRSASGTCSVAPAYSTLWGSTGSAATALITAYGLGTHGPNTGRLLASIARASSSPINVSGPPTNYYAFTLTFTTDNAIEGGGGSCLGCPDPVQIVWNKGILYSVSGAVGSEAAPVELSSTDPGSNPGVGVNAPSNPTAARSKTWGAVKALYR